MKIGRGRGPPIDAKTVSRIRRHTPRFRENTIQWLRRPIESDEIDFQIKAIKRSEKADAVGNFIETYRIQGQSVREFLRIHIGAEFLRGCAGWDDSKLQVVFLRMLFKKGKVIVNNFRAVTLISVVLRILGGIVTRRLQRVSREYGLANKS